MSRLLELEMSGDEPVFTGQVFFRDASFGGNQELPNGLKLMMVCGVIAVPEDFQIPGENMVMARGYKNKDSVEIHVEPTGKPIAGIYSAKTIDAILMSPVWRL